MASSVVDTFNEDEKPTLKKGSYFVLDIHEDADADFRGPFNHEEDALKALYDWFKETCEENGKYAVTRISKIVSVSLEPKITIEED